MSAVVPEGAVHAPRINRGAANKARRKGLNIDGISG
jgi:hypothetical protein